MVRIGLIRFGLKNLFNGVTMLTNNELTKLMRNSYKVVSIFIRQYPDIELDDRDVSLFATEIFRFKLLEKTMSKTMSQFKGGLVV